MQHSASPTSLTSRCFNVTEEQFITDFSMKLLMCCMMLQQNVYLLANTGLLQDWTVAFP
jgi:hypothetical protein